MAFARVDRDVRSCARPGPASIVQRRIVRSASGGDPVSPTTTGEIIPQSERRALVCYVPGLDTRRISDYLTPQIAELIRQHSSIEISTLPSTDLVPTFLTGVYPHQHLSWQVSLDARSERTMNQRLLDLLPDIVATTAQCVRQTFDFDFDLATLPPRRRREFTQHRCKYTRRVTSPKIMDRFGA